MGAFAFCSGCGCVEAVDAHWRSLWIDSDGDLRVTRPEHGCDLDFERPDTVFACGQGSALVVTERYLHGVPLDGAYELHRALTSLVHA